MDFSHAIYKYFWSRCEICSKLTIVVLRKIIGSLWKFVNRESTYSETKDKIKTVKIKTLEKGAKYVQG